MTTRLSVALMLAVVCLAAASAGASERATAAGASANAFGIKVLVPGQPGGSSVAVSAPPDSVLFSAGFRYPADGSAVTTGAITGSASAEVTANATATASSEVDSLSLFGGELTASSVITRSKGDTSGQTASGGLTGSSVSGLIVLGAAVAAGTNGRVGLGDWGYAITLEQTDTHAPTNGADFYHGFVTGLDIHLTADHGGLPAGSEILVGSADATVQAASVPPTTPKPPTGHGPKTKRIPKAPEPKNGHHDRAGGTQPIPFGIVPKLTAGGYVFPVYGPSSFIDSFGVGRADVSYHHGDDIFAPLGAPLLACADGTVFSVGFNKVGGWRLWLVDHQGNQFYYAHLSAYSSLAKNGNHVKAGEVLGFVGNTGDAQGTPPHLHFEVHPVGRLYLGYDGAVNPTTYLKAWKRLLDVRFAAVAGWVPALSPSGPAPKAGAILLQSSDISEANGLDPGSLRRALRAPVQRPDDVAPKRDLGVG